MNKKAAFCACAADDLLDNHNTEQLKDTELTKAYVQAHSAPLCMNKLPAESKTAATSAEQESAKPEAEAN